MVYRYESDEDAFEGHPRPGSDLSVAWNRPPARTGPAPSRFPTPSLPRTSRIALSASAAPPPAPAPPPPAAPRPAPPAGGYATTQPLHLPRSRRARDTGRHGTRLWQVMFGGAAVLALFALCGLGGAALLADRATDPQVAPSPPAAAAPSPTQAERQDIDSRDTDPAPLTAKEVFPGGKVVVGDGAEPYEVLKSQSSGSCTVAASGEVADLLATLGCNQVVRASLRSPDGDHLLTAGLFNLTDKATAQRVRDRLRQLLDEREGRFRGLPAGDDTEALTEAPARVGWQVRGHYLAYCLVVRADGEPVQAADPKAREILFDLIELHLTKGVLERRATGGTAGQPNPTPSDSDEDDSEND
ncbi:MULTISPECIES: hypothetical protein [unclassified Micromonospora]|uniref:hypothetical protein n=1 Tax=unclassified Micromonospora TaxID=2617518 RepID=UPI00362AFE50